MSASLFLANRVTGGGGTGVSATRRAVLSQGATQVASIAVIAGTWKSTAGNRRPALRPEASGSHPAIVGLNGKFVSDRPHRHPIAGLVQEVHTGMTSLPPAVGRDRRLARPIGPQASRAIHRRRRLPTLIPRVTNAPGRQRRTRVMRKSAPIEPAQPFRCGPRQSSGRRGASTGGVVGTTSRTRKIQVLPIEGDQFAGRLAQIE